MNSWPPQPSLFSEKVVVDEKYDPSLRYEQYKIEQLCRRGRSLPFSFRLLNFSHSMIEEALQFPDFFEYLPCLKQARQSPRDSFAKKATS